MDVGTMFPDVINYENTFIKTILQEMSKSFDCISPIIDLEPELFKKNCSTSTDFIDINDISCISANIKQSYSRPPSRMGLIKIEKSCADNQNGVLTLWELLGKTIFALIQHGKNEFQDNEIDFFKDIVDFFQQGKEKQSGMLLV